MLTAMRGACDTHHSLGVPDVGASGTPYSDKGNKPTQSIQEYLTTVPLTYKAYITALNAILTPELEQHLRGLLEVRQNAPPTPLSLDYRPLLGQGFKSSKVWLGTGYSRLPTVEEIEALKGIERYCMRECKCEGPQHWHLYWSSTEKTTYAKAFKIYGKSVHLRILTVSDATAWVVKLRSLPGVVVENGMDEVAPPKPPPVKKDHKRGEGGKFTPTDISAMAPTGLPTLGITAFPLSGIPVLPSGLPPSAAAFIPPLENSHKVPLSNAGVGIPIWNPQPKTSEPKPIGVLEDDEDFEEEQTPEEELVSLDADIAQYKAQLQTPLSTEKQVSISKSLQCLINQRLDIVGRCRQKLPLPQD